MGRSKKLINKDFTDEELVEALKSSHFLEEALDFVYANHFEMLKSIVMKNSGNEADAEDMVQEAIIAFMNVVRSGKYRGEANVSSFLYTLTKNLWFSELKKRGSMTKRNEVFETGRETLEKGVDETLIHNENLSLVSTLFAKLGDKCKQILSLFYFEEMSMKDILEHTSYENEQVLRNKKYKCQKELMRMVAEHPTLSVNLKNALSHGT